MSKEIRAALGQIEADVVFKNARIVDVFLHRIEEGDVALCNGKIIGIGKYSGKKEVDLKGKFLMPSFIDTHMHIESSMLSPAEYAKIVVPCGVSAVIADPHEITNVCGENGIRFMIDSAKGLPLDIHFMLPSCVPATPYDSSGAVIDSTVSKELLKKYNFLGLGEMMDYVAVLNSNEDTMKKINSIDFIDGHAPALSGKELCGYICAGIKTDHECVNITEALEKISRGMYIQIREGTSAKNLSSLINAVNPYSMNRLLFCTDDKHLDDIMEEGTISNCINKAIKYGVDPISAITISTINAAQCYGLKNRGAIAPGYYADIVIAEDLSANHILEVYKNGVLVAKDGKALFDKPQSDIEKVSNTLNLKPVTEQDFEMSFTPETPIIKVLPDTLFTEKMYKNDEEGLNICAVIERHKRTGNIGKAFVYGFNIKNGAVAQSIGHDSHNITVIGANPRDMALAVNSLGKDGGISVVINGEVVQEMLLPIAGLMSAKPAKDAADDYLAIKQAIKKLTPNTRIDTLMMLSFLSLLVIPEIKLNDHGLFDVNTQKFIG